MNRNTRSFRMLMFIASGTALTPLLLMLFYITGVNLLVAVNLIFVLIVFFAGIIQINGIVINWISKIFLFFIFVTFAKLLIFTVSDPGFETSLMLTHFFGLIMPFVMVSFFSNSAQSIEMLSMQF